MPSINTPPWALALTIAAGFALVMVALCPHLDPVGRIVCGFVGATLLLAFCAKVTGLSTVREIANLLRRR